MKLATLGALVLSSAFVAASARAQQWPTTDPGFTRPDESLATGIEGFGTPGQMLITSEFDLDLRYVSESLSGLSQSGPEITISPALMFFLAPQLAVGGILGFHHESREKDSNTVFVGPTIAYNIPISPRASIFPMVGLAYTWFKTSQDLAGGRRSNSGYDLGLLIKGPVLFHPFPHVFVGFGPIIVIDFVSKVDMGAATKTRSFGLTLDLGFWL
jgi:hypothetical protein